MANSLKTLERIQKFNIDEQRKILVELQNHEEKLQKALIELSEAYEREKEYAQNFVGMCDFGAYVKRYLAQREALELAIADVETRIERVRDVIADMFKEQKTYEIVDDNRKKRVQKDLDSKEQKMLDEIGTNTYIKHKAAK